MKQILYEFELKVCSTSGRLNHNHTLMTRWSKPISKLINMNLGDIFTAEVIKENNKKFIKIYLRD